MQTIVRKDNNVSLYYLADSKTVNIGSDQTTISEGGTLELIIADCNSSNATLHQGVDAKADWWGHKYKYDGSSWSNNSDYVGVNSLASDINASVTTIPVLSSNPFTSSGTVQINDEKITYTGVDGTNLTGCTRGANSTTAASHKDYDKVKQI
jgi:hypothetical protein